MGGIVQTLIGLGLQLVDLHNMIAGWIVFAVVAIIGGVWWHRHRRAAGKHSVEPSHLIIFGLVGMALCTMLTAGGYIWLSHRETQSESQAAAAIANPHKTTPIYIEEARVRGQLLYSAAPRRVAILTGITKVAGTRLRFYVKQHRPERIKLSDEIIDYVPGVRIEVPIISTYLRKGQLERRWGDVGIEPPPLNEMFDSEGLSPYQEITIIIIGPDGGEQAVPFQIANLFDDRNVFMATIVLPNR
jgi:hypothetical protein